LKNKGIRTCIPGRKQGKTAVRYDKRRNRIEFMCGRLKDWQWSRHGMPDIQTFSFRQSQLLQPSSTGFES
jgi:hypothetical protein